VAEPPPWELLPWPQIFCSIRLATLEIEGGLSPTARCSGVAGPPWELLPWLHFFFYRVQTATLEIEGCLPQSRMKPLAGWCVDTFTGVS